MEKDVAIEIRSKYRRMEDSDEIDFFTEGAYYTRDGEYCISYDETEITGMAGTHTELSVSVGERPCVTLRRTGKYESQLIVEKGQRYQCLYNTDAGAMVIGVHGSRVDADFDDDGGSVTFEYTLDVNTQLASENLVTVIVSTLPEQRIQAQSQKSNEDVKM